MRMRRVVCSSTIAMLLALGAPAAELKVPPPFRPILDLVNSSPPEFAAQAMLRMVASGKIDDKETRRQLCLRAFEAAASAHERIMRRAIPGVTGDSVAGALDASYRLRLDMLSLQSKAVLLLLHDDKRKAREIFEQIPRPSIPQLTCGDALIYDVSDYVAALQAVEEQSFTEAERKKEDHVAFLLTYLSGITSPSELAPAARLAAGAGGLTNSERDLLVNRFNGVLEAMNPDYRAFAAIAGDLRSAITPAMRLSFDKLADKVKNSTHCGDPSSSAFKPVRLAPGVTPPQMPDTQPFWQSAGAKEMLTRAKKVRFGDDRKPYTNADRETPEWRDQYAEFVGSLDSWNPDPDEPPAVFFHERVIIYQGLMDIAPTAAARRRLLEDFMGFLNASPLQRDNPPEWFSTIAAMWHRIPFHEAGEPEACADALSRSGNPVVSLYLMLEKIIPEPFGGFH